MCAGKIHPEFFRVISLSVSRMLVSKMRVGHLVQIPVGKISYLSFCVCKFKIISTTRVLTMLVVLFIENLKIY